jgi:hypothetical protein
MIFALLFKGLQFTTNGLGGGGERELLFFLSERTNLRNSLFVRVDVSTKTVLWLDQMIRSCRFVVVGHLSKCAVCRCENKTLHEQHVPQKGGEKSRYYFIKTFAQHKN